MVKKRVISKIAKTPKLAILDGKTRFFLCFVAGNARTTITTSIVYNWIDLTQLQEIVIVYILTFLLILPVPMPAAKSAARIITPVRRFPFPMKLPRQRFLNR